MFLNVTMLAGIAGALVRKRYQDNQRRHARELEEACRTLRAEWQTFVTDKSLADSLPAFLHHRLAR